MRGYQRRGVMALLVASAVVLARPSLADDAIAPEARDAIEKMSKSLSTGSYSFDFDTFRQFEKDNQPLHIYHHGQVLVQRPDHLMVDINGDDGKAQISYNGTMLTIYSAKANKYAQLPVTGSIETMLRAASEKIGMDFPLADFLADHPGQAFLSDVQSGKKVDVAVINGQECNHFLFLQPPGIELELWTEANEEAWPRRVVITYRSVAGEPQFLSAMSDWRLRIPPDDAFDINIPAGATKAEGRGQ